MLVNQDEEHNQSYHHPDYPTLALAIEGFADYFRDQMKRHPVSLHAIVCPAYESFHFPRSFLEYNDFEICVAATAVTENHRR
jgi:hypothetical protein